MFAPSRLLLYVLIAGIAYLLWPRTPDLRGFRPSSLAELQIEVWRKAQERDVMALVGTLYKINQQQYGFSPASSLMLAQSYGRAMYIYRKAPDVADQEKALPLLQETYAKIRRAGNLEFDSDIAARTEFTIWMQYESGAAPEQIAPFIANLWSAIYGIPSAQLQPSALAYAKSMMQFRQLKPNDKWARDKAEKLLIDSLRQLKLTVAPRGAT